MFSPRHARETSRSTIRLRLSVKANIYFGGFCTLSKYTYQIKIFTTVAHSLFFFYFSSVTIPYHIHVTMLRTGRLVVLICLSTFTSKECLST